MDILNNLWNAMITENQMMISLLSFPCTFIENYLIMILFINLFGINVKYNKQIIFVVLISLIIILIMQVVPNPFNLILNYMSFFILILLIFKLSVIKSIIATVIPLLSFALVGNLILNPYLSICNITYEQFMVIPLYRIIYLFLMYSSVFIISIILKKFKNFKFDLLDDLDKRQKSIIALNFIFGLFSIAIQFFLTVYYVNTYPVIFTILNFIALFSYFAISTFSLTRIVKLDAKTKELESAEAYNKSLSILHDSVRGFKHDFDNIVATIGGYIKTNDMEGLKKYYYQLEDDCQRVNNIAALNPELINNSGIYNLLSVKYHEADEKNIKINLEFFLDLNTIHMKIYEFTRILGILLDNAIESACECEEKIINIKFRNEEKNHRQVIIIENTYLNKDVDTEEIFKKGFSEKEEHTGLGLWEIRQIIKKNDNVNLFTNKTDNLFIQQLEIYYK